MTERPVVVLVHISEGIRIYKYCLAHDISVCKLRIVWQPAACTTATRMY